MSVTFIIVGIIVIVFWLVPASILTIKIRQQESMSQALKSQLIKPLWLIPLIGNIVCYFFFAKTGKLNALSASEHRSIWTVHK